MARYVLGSVITTGVSFSSIAILYGFRIIPGVMWSTLAGNLIATLPAYWLNRTWTWGKRGRSHFRREIVPFWSMSFSGIAFSQLGAFWARHEVHTHTWNRLVDTALVTGTNVVCFADLLRHQAAGVQPDLPREQARRQIEEHLTMEERRRALSRRRRLAACPAPR